MHEEYSNQGEKKSVGPSYSRNVWRLLCNSRERKKYHRFPFFTHLLITGPKFWLVCILSSKFTVFIINYSFNNLKKIIWNCINKIHNIFQIIKNTKDQVHSSLNVLRGIRGLPQYGYCLLFFNTYWCPFWSYVVSKSPPACRMTSWTFDNSSKS